MIPVQLKKLIFFEYWCFFAVMINILSDGYFWERVAIFCWISLRIPLYTNISNGPLKLKKKKPINLFRGSSLTTTGKKISQQMWSTFFCSNRKKMKLNFRVKKDLLWKNKIKLDFLGKGIKKKQFNLKKCSSWRSKIVIDDHSVNEET
jgi:hypothetical protein